MKKIKYCIFLLIVFIVPISVNAYELNCDKSTINYDENFFCYLTGTNNQTYTELSGDITSTNNLVECTPTSFSNGLNIMESPKKFAYYGNPTDNRLIVFSCKLTKQLSAIEKTQIKIDNFKYAIEGANTNENEILSTDFINANIYNDSQIDDLPRNTSNPNSLLKNLHEDNLNIVFSRFVTIYNQEVLYEVDKLNLNVIANNPSATIKIVGNDIENNTSLNVGKNVINIFVTAPDGVTTTCYTLNVNRLARGESIYYPEKDATLYSLIVPGYAISFDKDIYEYRIHLASDVSKVTVDAIPTYDEAKVDISSTTNLKNNSVIKITVTSKDKSTIQDYTIKVTKDAPKVNYIPYIVSGAIGILFIVMIVLFIKTSKTKKSGGPTVIPNIEIDSNHKIENNQNLNTNNINLSNENTIVENKETNLNNVPTNTNQQITQVVNSAFNSQSQNLSAQNVIDQSSNNNNASSQNNIQN